MPLAQCPDRAQLAGFSLGTLPESALDRLCEHAESCTACQQSLETLDQLADPLLQWLQLANASPFPAANLAPLLDRAGSISLLPWQATDAHPGTPLPPLLLPKQVGPYRLIEPLGQGGMGAVYKALHLRLEKFVAVKLLPPDRLRDPAALARFEREMKAVGQLTHPNIVAAHDAGEAEGLHYLVMELVDGLDLSTLVRQRGPLPIPVACELARQTALGLAAIAERGLVHRDIKPSNLMVVSRELRVESRESVERAPVATRLSTLNTPLTVKILDLGLALLSDRTLTLPADALDVDNQGARSPSHPHDTLTHHIMGTADYMAPEQIADSHRVDIRADLYSLGCTLYKLLTGRAPFATDQYPTTADKLWAHLHAPILPLTDLRPDAPAELVQVVNRLLARDPAQRYATPTEAAAALAPFGFAPSEPADAPSNPTRKRGRLAPWLIALAALALPLAALLSLFNRHDDAVLLLTFDEETRYQRDGQDFVRDQSPRHNDAQIHGATWTPHGKIGGAMQFDGLDDYLEFPDAGFPSGDHPRTITFWFKTAGLAPKPPHAMTLFWYGPSRPLAACYLALLPDPTYDRLSVGDAGGGPYEQTAPPFVLDNTWRHAALVYDGHLARLYLDGTLLLEYPRPFATQLTGTARVGHSEEPQETYFQGVIDEVRVFDQPFSHLQIQELSK